MDASSAATPPNENNQNRVILKMLATLGITVLLAVPVFFLVALQRSTNSRMLRVGDPVPAVALVGVDPGGAFIAGVSGKRTAVLFFSVDCPRCQNAIPVFNEAERRFGSEVDFVAVALNARNSVEPFVKTHIVRTRILIDERGTVAKHFGISEVPTLFLVNPAGIITWVEVGELSRTALLRQLSVLADEDVSGNTNSTQENLR